MTKKLIRYAIFCVPALIGILLFFRKKEVIWAAHGVTWYFIMLMVLYLALLSAMLIYGEAARPKNLSVMGEMRARRGRKSRL